MHIGPVKRESSNRGFTLLELIVVVAVLGILLAIAIQRFAIYRGRAIDAAMRSDLKNAALAMESYYGEFLEHPASLNAIQLVGFRKTGGLTLTITVPTAVDVYVDSDHGKWNTAELHIRQRHWID
jgi:prepilin-type N-terminal cleavage/methylation domain-containing protein